MIARAKRPFHRVVQVLLEIDRQHAGGVEDPLVEAQEHDDRAQALERLGRLEAHRSVLQEIGRPVEAEAPDAGVGRVQLHAEGLVGVDVHGDVLGRGAQAGRDELQVEHVVVVERLDGVGHLVAGVVGMVPVRADAPAELDAAALVDDAAAPGLLPVRPVDVPFPDVLVETLAGAVRLEDGEIPDLDVAEVLAVEVDLGDLVAGIDVPGLQDRDLARRMEGDRDVQVPDLLIIRKSGKGGDPCRYQSKPETHA